MRRCCGHCRRPPVKLLSKAMRCHSDVSIASPFTSARPKHRAPIASKREVGIIASSTVELLVTMMQTAATVGLVRRVVALGRAMRTNSLTQSILRLRAPAWSRLSESGQTLTASPCP
ncbi:hypothetical protein TcWFU_003030 [Taenia crassiceps]|uniref:Uncharacterized protein n=1 Tax=Taenia crassiceps TaxID=6207 RepID=A0ABR4QKH0_9CEST